LTTLPFRDPASYTDPNGYVYWQDGQVYRHIHAQSAPLMRTLVAHPTFTALAAAGKLAGASVAQDDGETLVLAHPLVGPANYPGEWCAAMLQDAASLVLEVAAEAAAVGYGLADGHPWNVFFQDSQPRFLDWGSFGAPSETLLWPAQVQFDRFALYPLHLYAAGHQELARARLADLALGVSAGLASRTLGPGYRFTHPKLAMGLAAQALAERLTSNPQSSGSAPRKADPQMLARLRPGYFRGLQAQVAGVSLPKARSDWAGYYGQCPSMDAQSEEAKLRLVERVLGEWACKSVLDLGTNTGRFALMAARQGARVTAIDQDDASVALLYQTARQQNLPILPLVMDLGNPTPATGWCAEQRPDALTRLAGELTLMLALVHHLVFTGNHSLEQVARLARKSTRRLALIEWVAPEDAMALYLRRTATKDFGFYTLGALVTALEAEGFTVEPLTAHAPTRQLLACSL
jgi:SAM-dependent methyltransferase